MADMHIDDELRVAQTTPQGSQADAVDSGYEERDANVGAIMRWLTGTGIFVAVVLVGLVFLYKALVRGTEGRYQVPLLYAEQQKPVPPYIEGLVVGGRVDDKALIVGGERAGMTEHLAKVHAREVEQLNRWGFSIPAPKPNDPHAKPHEGEHGEHHDSTASQPTQNPGELTATITDDMVKEVSAENPAGVSAARTTEVFAKGSQSDSTGGRYDLPVR